MFELNGVMYDDVFGYEVVNYDVYDEAYDDDTMRPSCQIADFAKNIIETMKKNNLHKVLVKTNGDKYDNWLDNELYYNSNGTVRVGYTLEAVMYSHIIIPENIKSIFNALNEKYPDRKFFPWHGYGLSESSYTFNDAFIVVEL